MNSKEFLTHLLKTNNKNTALETVSNKLVSYEKLAENIEKNAILFREVNISENDTVAIVLGNGPDMASIFLSVLYSAIAAPLNPLYTESEFKFYMEDLDVCAVVIDENDKGPARKVAIELGLIIIYSKSIENQTLSELKLNENE